MRYLAIDPSKRSTGFAIWRDEWSLPKTGTWVLGSEYTKRGATCRKLHICLNELRQTFRFEKMFVEEPIAQKKGRNTSERNVRLALGLASHIESYAASYGLENHLFEYSPESWRTAFCGRDETLLIKRAARRAEESASDPLKAAVKERCRQLGIIVQKHDESDAAGILTYGLLNCGVTPPWIANETLRPMLVGAR